MDMTIAITEADITAAVREALLKKVPFIPEDIDVKYTAGRGDNGMSAEVKFQLIDGTVQVAAPVPSKVTVRKAEKSAPPEAPAAKEEAKTVPEPEPKDDEPPFEPDEKADAPAEAEEAKADTKADEESADPIVAQALASAKQGKSLFADLNAGG
jgi:type IV secretory pathway VirB10-like protein